MKALNERLSKVEQSLSWPSMDEGGEAQTAATPPKGTTSPATSDKLVDVKVERPPSAERQPKLPVPDFHQNAKELDKPEGKSSQ